MKHQHFSYSDCSPPFVVSIITDATSDTTAGNTNNANTADLKMVSRGEIYFTNKLL